VGTLKIITRISLEESAGDDDPVREIPVTGIPMVHVSTSSDMFRQE
jgi:hypothetical protein